MTFLPICAHSITRYTRLIRGGQVSRCTGCGVEFVTVARHAHRATGDLVPRPSE